ncbi:unnamed protein product [Closterium sp. NIES-65]|nr:unnamed protein product [Closterium sp. NIES-65]
MRAANLTLPSSLKSLNFFYCCPSFYTIFPSASPFTGLQELLITDCSGLESLPDGIGELLPNFGHLPALKVLVLRALYLRELPPSFCHLLSLEALFLDDCFDRRHVDQLPAGFCRLTALKALCVSSRNPALPEDIGALASLQILRLDSFREQPLPASFTQLSSLTSLKLDVCRLGNLPEALGEFSSLRELKLREDAYARSIRTLPSSIVRLTRLHTLEVRDCRSLSEVPRLDALVGLKKLELTDCRQLSRPPARLPPALQILLLGPFKKGPSRSVDISQLSQLRVLKLNCVGVRCGRAVSGRLSCLQQLQQLEMRLEDDSQELPVPLTCLPRLRSLLIEAPGLCSLPENMGAALPQLRQLKLLSWSQGKLPGSIVELTSLTSLTINTPRLVALPLRMSRLSRLRKLELIRCNALQQLPAFLTQLHQLILRNTSIRSLPANLVRLDS